VAARFLHDVELDSAEVGGWAGAGLLAGCAAAVLKAQACRILPRW
jgi:hypothetical protein